MKTVNVINNQSLYDIALQTTGSANAVHEIASLNNLSVTDLVQAGSIIKLPATAYDADILALYKAENVRPATAFSGSELQDWMKDLPAIVNIDTVTIATEDDTNEDDTIETVDTSPIVDTEQYSFELVNSEIAEFTQKQFATEWTINFTEIGWKSAVVFEVIDIENSEFLQLEPRYEYKVNRSILKVHCIVASKGKVVVHKMT